MKEETNPITVNQCIHRYDGPSIDGVVRCNWCGKPEPTSLPSKPEEEKPDLQHFLRSFRLSYTLEGDDNGGLSLLDRLTPDEDESVTRGLQEIEFLAEEIEDIFILPLQSRIKELEKENADLKFFIRIT